MPQVVRFDAPYRVSVAEVPQERLGRGDVRVRTLYSGISAGTELTAYRGTNPYLVSAWDPELRLFTDPPDVAPGYPLEGWGYSEVGEVVEVSAIDGPSPQVGDVVWGIWGHRSEACLNGAVAKRQTLPAGVPGEVGTFARVGSVALNAVLAAQCGIGSTVVVLGQGVIGLLATAFAVRSGCRVIAVDRIEARRLQALRYGAEQALGPDEEVAGRVRALTGGRGADAVIELSGSYAALHEGTRIAGPDAHVVAAGFYQGPADALRLGQEFHHNRVSIVSSQIGAVASHLQPRWSRERLTDAVMAELAGPGPRVLELVRHRFPVDGVAEAFELLDQRPAEALQVLLEF
ncbi:MAG TPA: zinc-binding dehydrogenase [Nocardioides sp.]|jgi:2-desacetyl-2-hydroxyethyl bacteriochlorophyllide A dehydrogenase|nr:zinc-binding dehydrogenase [Nocardioides sp.]